MKVREVIKLIEMDGWYRIKARGGHRQYKHPVRWARYRSRPNERRFGQENREEHIAPSRVGRIMRTWEVFVEIYLMVIGRTSTGYSAHCPDVLGCAAVGKTVEAIVVNMKKALELHFEGMAEDGDPLPKPGGVASYRKLIKDLDLDKYILAHVQIDTRPFAALVSHS